MRMIFQRRIHLSWCINLNFELTLLGIIQRHKRLLLVAWVHDLQLEYDSNKKECMLKVPLFAHLDLRWKAFKISNWETRPDLLELVLASKIFPSFQMKLKCVRIFLQKRHQRAQRMVKDGVHFKGLKSEQIFRWYQSKVVHFKKWYIYFFIWCMYSYTG